MNGLAVVESEETKKYRITDAWAIQTLLNGGIVYVVEPGKIPDTGSLTAVFGYQFSTIFYGR